MSGLKTRRAFWRENADREHTLYRLFDAEDSLLYVGVTFMPGHRINQHSKKTWGAGIARKELVTFPNRREALEAERKAIQTEGPRHNIQMRVT